MNTRSLIRRVGHYKQELAQKILFGGEQVLSICHIRAVAHEIGYRYRVRRWPPWLTVLGFLTQTLEQDQSCRNAVAKIWAWLSVLGGELVNTDTGPYCDARKRLPEALLSRLSAGKGADLEAQVQGRDRWQCELDFRSIKAVMKMDVLRCKTPAMVRKEITVHLLGYNVIRGLMYEAASRTSQVARRLSFKGTLQALNSFWPLMIVLPHGMRHRLYELLLIFVGREKLPFRPNRIEPRKIKRRPKSYPLLNVPRHEARRREKT